MNSVNVSFERACHLGAAGKRLDYVVWGDYHALAIAPAFTKSAKQMGHAGYFVGAAACTPLLGVFVGGRGVSGNSCAAVN